MTSLTVQAAIGACLDCMSAIGPDAAQRRDVHLEEIVTRLSRPAEMRESLADVGGAPHKGTPLIEWMASRYGGAARVRQMASHASAAAAGEGLRFDFERAVMANTFEAHRLIAWTASSTAVPFGATADTQAQLVEALHKAHLTDGLDVGSRNVLTSLAGQVGLDAGRVRRLLHSTDGVAEVRAELAQARQLGGQWCPGPGQAPLRAA